MGRSLCRTEWKFFKRSNTQFPACDWAIPWQEKRKCVHTQTWALTFLTVTGSERSQTSICRWTRGQIVFTVSYYLALTSCTTGGPVQTSLVKDSRSQRVCARLYLHGVSKEGKPVGKWGIRGCLGLELGMGVLASEQGPLRRQKCCEDRQVTIIQVAANILRFTALCISSECIVCRTSYTQWSYLKLDGLRNGEGRPAEQTGWHNIYPDVLMGGSRSHVSRCLLYNYFNFAGYLEVFIR